MADRYWVGGSGTWDTTSTTNWSTSSGGASGASAPTAADNVFFDSNSNVGTGAFTVTVSAAVCNDFNAPGASTALDGAMTLAFASSTLTVSGSWTNQATNFAVTNTAGTLTFNATTTGKTITTNGVTIGVNTTLNGVGGAWTLGSALNISTFTLTLTNGTFDTSASNYAVTAVAFSSSNSNTRTINLNGSTVSLSSQGLTAWNLSTTTNATLNAGTSTITCTANNFTFAGGGLTYRNLSFTNTTIFNASKTITGANTFNNLTISGPSANGTNAIDISADQTINGTLTVNGSNGNRRIFVRSNTMGTTRTLTCAAIAAMTDVDFRDIAIAGAAGTLSGTRLGDCGGNSNITFVAGTNKYWNLAAGGNWTSTAWALSSGGSVATTNHPLPQDTAIIENTGLNTSATITIDAAQNVGSLNLSSRTNAMTLANGINQNITFYGNFTYGSGVTPTGTSAYTFSNRSTKTLNSGGKTFTQPVTIFAPSGGIQLVTNNLTLGSTLATTLTQGTLDLNNLTLTTGSFVSSFSNTRTIAFGTGNISCSGTGTVWNTGTVTNLTTTGTQVVNVTSAGSTAINVSFGALSEANSISFNFTGGTYALTVNDASTAVRSLNFTGYSGTLGQIVGTTIFGNLTLSTGMSLTASNVTMTFGATSGTQQITSNGKTMDFPISFNGVGGTFSLQDAMTLGSTRTMTLTNGTLNLNGNTCTVGTSFTTATGTKNLTFNGGTLVCPTASTTAFNNASPTNFTTTAGTGTGTISMTAATAKTFVGGGSTYNCTLNQGGAGALTITGSNTFNNITNTVQPASVLFTAGTTSTFLSGFSLSGTAGNLITIGSATAASHTLSKAGGTVSVSYCSISRSSATGGAIWQAFTSNGNVDGGNNTGWLFTASSAATGNFLMFF